MLRQGYWAVRIIIVASNLCQFEGTHDTSEDDIEELEALHILHCGHQCNGDVNAGPVSLAHSSQHQGAVSDLLGKVKGRTIKSTRSSQHLVLI